MRDRLGGGRRSTDSPPLIRMGAADCDVASEAGSTASGRGSGSRAGTPVSIRRRKDGASSRSTDRASVSSAEEATTDIDDEFPLKTRYPLVNSIGREARWFYLDVIDAFERKQVDSVEGVDGQMVKLFDPKTSLSIVALRRDLKRLFAAAKPLLEAGAAAYDLLLWRNPIATLLLVLVYMYSIWVGYFWALVFMLLLFQLTLNYFHAVHGVDIGLNFLPRKEVRLPGLDMSSGQLVIDLAKVAQWGVSFTADVLEKFETLFTWKRPEITWHFYYLCVYWLAWSLCFSIGTCFGACAMTFGIRLFVTTYLFDKFPRLRYRLDTYGYFYRNLPVKTGEIPTRPFSSDARSFPSALSLAKRSQSVDFSTMTTSMATTASIDRTMGSSVALSDTDSSDSIEEEDMVEDVIDHRRCLMAEKQTKGTVAGTLHLTPTALLFRGHSDNTERMILLDEIASIRQTLPLRSISLLGGPRKGIDVDVYDSEEGYGGRRTARVAFLSISKRDELFDNIERVCQARGTTRAEFVRARPLLRTATAAATPTFS